jgi:hypothetical protein
MTSSRHVLSKTLAIITSGMLLLGLFASVVFTIDAYAVKPVNQFVWRDIETKSECVATTLVLPDIGPARVVDFASDAVVNINSYDYLNQEVVISSALRQFFTKQGAYSYMDQVNRSGAPAKFRQNFVEQSSYKAGVPNIKEEGRIGTRRFWRVEVPMCAWPKNVCCSHCLS